MRELKVISDDAEVWSKNSAVASPPMLGRMTQEHVTHQGAQ